MRRVVAYTLVSLMIMTNIIFVSTCTTPVSEKADTFPPNPITTVFFYQVSSAAVELGWIAPSDNQGDSVIRYDCRYSLDSLTLENWEQATIVAQPPQPGHVGAYERLYISNLEPSLAYFFGIRSVDRAGNWSVLSDLVVRESFPPDTIPPTTITDLSVIHEDSDSFILSWSAPAEQDSLAAFWYEIRYDTTLLLSDQWDSSHWHQQVANPKLPGTTEEITISNLIVGKRYYAAIRSADFDMNWSSYSNVVYNTPPGDTTTPSVYIVDVNVVSHPLNVVPSFIEVLPNHDISIVGTAFNGFNAEGIYSARCDESGTVLSDSIFSGTTGEYALETAMSTEGKLVIIKRDDSWEVGIRLFDDIATERVHHMFDSSTYGYFWPPRIIATPDGGFAALLSVYYPSPVGGGQLTAVRVVKLDGEGSEQWRSTHFVGTPCFAPMGDDVTPWSTGGGISVVGSSLAFAWVASWSKGAGMTVCDPVTQESYVTVLDQFGNEVGQTTLGDRFLWWDFPFAPTLTTSGRLIPSNSELLLIAPDHHLYDPTYTPCHLFRCNQQGQVIDSVATDPGITIAGFLETSLITTLIYGSASAESSNQKLGVTLIDASGAVLWQYIYPGTGVSKATDAHLLPNGDILVLGYTAFGSDSTRGLLLNLKKGALY